MFFNKNKNTFEQTPSERQKQDELESQIEIQDDANNFQVGMEQPHVDKQEEIYNFDQELDSSEKEEEEQPEENDKVEDEIQVQTQKLPEQKSIHTIKGNIVQFDESSRYTESKVRVTEQKILNYQNKEENQFYEPGLNIDNENNLPKLRKLNNQIQNRQIQAYQDPAKGQKTKKTLNGVQLIRQEQSPTKQIQEVQSSTKKKEKDVQFAKSGSPVDCLESSPGNALEKENDKEENLFDNESNVNQFEVQSQNNNYEQRLNLPHQYKQKIRNPKWPFPPRMNIQLVPYADTMMKQFLTSPIPQNTVLSCFIRRSKSGLAKLYPVYHLYTDEGQKYLLTAKKLAMNKTSQYIICMKQDNLSTKSESYLGKVQSNFLGTEFIMFDNGVNPKKTKNSMEIRNQLGVVFYESNLLSNKGPRRMQIIVPKVSLENNMAKQFMPLHSKEGMQFDYRSGKNSFIDVFINKPPRWNEQIQAYVLNFFGRVDKPSVKNFQLIKPGDQDQIAFQFGRVDDLNFNLDFTWPFSPLQAMQICVSSFDYKFACE